ncbi:MAG: TRAP transporter small permease [Chloroflexi bacterium]|nr:TRAP transporter small permease [Chloroflexota bacterium]
MSRLFDRVLTVTMWGAVIATVLVIIGGIDLEVVLRYGLNRPTRWVVPVAEFALVYALFLSAAWVLAREGHVKVEIVVDFLPPNARRWVNTIGSAMGTISCAIFFAIAVLQTFEAIKLDQFIMRSINVPKWVLWIVISLGSLLLVIQFARRTWRSIKGESFVTEEQSEY